MVSAPFAALGASFGAPVAPTPLPAPRLVHVNEALAASLGIATDASARERLATLVAGASVPEGWTPFASVYAGHQFGVFVPRLGDGRALVLGTIVADDGTPHELQLKGGGPTPWSRMGDGRAVLRSTIREYVACEAMHALGIPTSRALAMIASPALVRRERPEPAAALIRSAPTHVRFGTFEWLAVERDAAAMATLVDYVCDGFLPEVPPGHLADRTIAMLHVIAERTARLVAQWMGVGFVHTVMNTDNMSVLGLTIDYGPYAFMEGYDAAFTPNHSDPWGRYAYGAQPAIARWNLERLGDALSLVAPRARLDEAIAHFTHTYDAAWTRTLHAKLGFMRTTPGTRRCADVFIALLADQRADFTRAFRALGTVTTGSDAPAAARDEFAHPEPFDRWCIGYRAQLRAEGSDDARRRASMARVNPRLVPRTHVLQRAIDAAERGDDREVARLVAAFAEPWSERDGDDDLLLPGPADGHALSCSS